MTLISMNLERNTWQISGMTGSWTIQQAHANSTSTCQFNKHMPIQQAHANSTSTCLFSKYLSISLINTWEKSLTALAHKEEHREESQTCSDELHGWSKYVSLKTSIWFIKHYNHVTTGISCKGLLSGIECLLFVNLRNVLTLTSTDSLSKLS